MKYNYTKSILNMKYFSIFNIHQVGRIEQTNGPVFGPAGRMFDATALSS